jgi:hypothetical protein
MRRLFCIYATMRKNFHIVIVRRLSTREKSRQVEGTLPRRALGALRPRSEKADSQKPRGITNVCCHARHVPAISRQWGRVKKGGTSISQKFRAIQADKLNFSEHIIGKIGELLTITTCISPLSRVLKSP